MKNYMSKLKGYNEEELEQYCTNIVDKYKNNNRINYLQDFVECCERYLETGDISLILWNSKRKKLVEEYSWAIPNKKSINYLSNYNNLVEVGAGSGYWAYLINKNEGDCSPYDKTNINGYCEVKNYNGDIEINNLLLCWPPSKNKLAYNITKNKKPKNIVFIGLKTDVTGSKEFHKYIKNNYREINVIDIPSWPRVDDKLYSYRII